MKIRTSILAQFGLLVVAILFSIYMSAKLPDVVPTHWGIQGKPDAYGSKWMNLCLMPGVILFLAVLTAVLPKISPRRFRMEPFEDTYGYVTFLVGVLMLALHVVIVEASASQHLDIGKAMMAVLFGFWALLGNVMGKIKQNFFMGIRTPWTLADERVWHATHRYAGRVWTIGGIIGLVAALFGLPISWAVGYMMVIAFLPVVKSYLIYVKLGPSA